MDITELRSRINEIDDQLTKLFIDRMKVSAQVADYKIQNNMPVKDAQREQQLLNNLAEKAGKMYAPYVRALYAEILDLSRQLQSLIIQINSIEYGLIGEDVSYSYSKWIHHAMGNRNFGLYSIPVDILPVLFSRRPFKGLNISSSYKAEVVKYCDKLDHTAERTGYVNTILKKEDGTLTGYNTEYDGIITTASIAKIDFSGKKVMILGKGSFASSAAIAALDKGASEIISVTRTGKINFNNIYDHTDVDIIINGTPIGMTPNVKTSPVDLSKFPHLSGVLDAVFTPVKTKLINQAVKLGIPCEDGLTALIAKSAKTSELFGFEADESICNDLYEELTSFIE